MQFLVNQAAKSSKNNRMIVMSGKRPMLIKTAKLKNEEEAFMWEMKPYIKETITKPCRLAVDFYFADKRKHDIDNCLNFLMDILVKTGVIQDDNLIVSIEADKHYGENKTIFTIKECI